MKAESTAPILVTGASTGIGRHITGYLAERGHAVFATARKDSDLESLATIDNVSPIRCDVTRPDEIRETVNAIVQTGRGLHGLVNNAGIGSIGYLHTVTDAEMREVLEVNTLGPHRMVNACLDLLLACRGRVVNIGSMGGLMAMKIFGPYCMSKFALEAYTLALRGELAPHGVKVSIVDPGGIVSEIGVNSAAGVRARLERVRPEFREEADQMLARLDQSNACWRPMKPRSTATHADVSSSCSTNTSSKEANPKRSPRRRARPRPAASPSWAVSPRPALPLPRPVSPPPPCTSSGWQSDPRGRDRAERCRGATGRW
jgi:NAD(P)-dependent dehydrogenase (short-subunit alcohol dehydrogenase family)